MQYKVEHVAIRQSQVTGLQKILNAYAAEGWHLVSTSTLAPNNIYLFFEHA